MELGFKDTYQGVDSMTGVFNWGYGSGGKGIAFWGWVDEEAGGGGYISKLVMELGSGICAVEKRRPVSVNRTPGIVEPAMSETTGARAFSMDRRKRAVFSPSGARPVKCSSDGPLKTMTSVTGEALVERQRVVRSGASPNVIVKPETR